MRKIGSVLASAGLAVGLLFLGSYASIIDSLRKAEALTTSGRPNMVFILTDDMRKDDLAYMPKTRSLLQGNGMTFRNAFVSTPLCSPSRASIMRGQYAHNTHVWANRSADSSTVSIGGWQAYQRAGNEADNVATRLRAAGYRTGLFGKYLNYYADTTYVPQGWSRWFGTWTRGDLHFFDYNVNVDGTTVHYGTSESDYKTDVISRNTNAFIANSVSRGKPFFAYVTPIAPHEPSTPAPRDAHDYDGIQGPRLPSFDEADVSDKPPWIGQLPRLTSDQISAINTRHEKRVESLQAVDDLVEGVVGTLRAKGVLSNTYVFFTSDNGFHHGEHRIANGKWRPYEEDVHMPLLVRGPGVAPGSTTNRLALNTDYLPTFTDLAGVQKPPYVDGRSLKPVLKGNATTTWRNAVLLESAAEASPSYTPAYEGIRTVNSSTTAGRKYVEYDGGTREFYRLDGPDGDPYELTNAYDVAAPPYGLASRVGKLENCRVSATGTATVPCKTAEDGR
jgi:arylsulfatase A-like enzyme